MDMTTHLDQTIEHYQGKIRALQKQLGEAKRMVNTLCVDAGREPIYATVDEDAMPALGNIKGDSFYGIPLATAVTTYLKMRKAANSGPAKITEIYEALKSGGFVFEAKSEDYSKRGLRNSLSKNTQTFHRLPGGDYGLREWYPALKNVRARPKDDDGAADDEGDDTDTDDGENFGGDSVAAPAAAASIAPAGTNVAPPQKPRQKAPPKKTSTPPGNAGG